MVEVLTRGTSRCCQTYRSRVTQTVASKSNMNLQALLFFDVWKMYHLLWGEATFVIRNRDGEEMKKPILCFKKWRNTMCAVQGDSICINFQTDRQFKVLWIKNCYIWKRWDKIHKKVELMKSLVWGNIRQTSQYNNKIKTPSKMTTRMDLRIYCRALLESNSFSFSLHWQNAKTFVKRGKTALLIHNIIWIDT